MPSALGERQVGRAAEATPQLRRRRRACWAALGSGGWGGAGIRVSWDFYGAPGGVAQRMVRWLGGHCSVLMCKLHGPSSAPVLQRQSGALWCGADRLHEQRMPTCSRLSAMLALKICAAVVFTAFAVCSVPRIVPMQGCACCGGAHPVWHTVQAGGWGLHYLL